MALFPDTPATLLKKIAALRAGDDAAVWADFVERYAAAVREFLRLNRQTVSEADLDDLVQDVFIRLVGVLRAEKYDASKARFRTYLAQIMRNLLVDRWREERGLECATGGSLGSLGEADPGMQMDAAWRLAVHRAAVQHVMSVSMLAPQSKEIYRAYVLEQRGIDEVARQFDVSRNQVSQVKTRVEKMIAAVEAAYAD